MCLNLLNGELIMTIAIINNMSGGANIVRADTGDILETFPTWQEANANFVRVSVQHRRPISTMITLQTTVTTPEGEDVTYHSDFAYLEKASKGSNLITQVKDANPLFKRFTSKTKDNIVHIMGSITTVKGIQENDNFSDRLKDDVACLNTTELAALRRFLNVKAKQEHQANFGTHRGQKLFCIEFLKAHIPAFIMNHIG